MLNNLVLGISAVLKVLIGVPHVFRPREGSDLSSSKQEKRSLKVHALQQCCLGNLDALRAHQLEHRYQSPGWITCQQDAEQHDVQLVLHAHADWNLIEDAFGGQDVPDDLTIVLHRLDDPSDLPLRVTRSLLEAAANDSSIDMVIYLEDDLLIEDRELLEKIRLLYQNFGANYCFMPHRCEVIPGLGDVVLSGEPLRERRDLFWATSETVHIDWLGSRKQFTRVVNPHSGCFFLMREQALLAYQYWQDRHWEIPYRWAGTMEMACTGIFLPIFRMMKIQVSQARFFQVRHQDCLWRDVPMA